jgi:hypothetical protein
LASPPPLLVVDGGPTTGFGHVGRCLAIWEELQGRATFAAEDPDLARLLRGLGAAVLVHGTGTPHASNAPDATSTLDAALLAHDGMAPLAHDGIAPLAHDGIAPLAHDGIAPLALIDRRRPTGAAEVARLQARGTRICLLDDAGEGRKNADLLIDPPTARRWPPAGGRRLAGFEHVLLRRDVRAAAHSPLEGVEVLLGLGGSDPEGLTPVLAAALRAAGVPVLSVLGPTHRGARPPGEVLADPRDWPRALAAARLLIGRFGHTLLEAAYLGTPTLALASGARAAGEASAFALHGTIEALRVDDAGGAHTVVERALALLEDAARLRAMAARGRRLVDGLGATRVVAALREIAP